uniref:Uncharacterized protein n=1 Tax=Lepeophtheirus salmonis TaxID=72036 RepID=A0A0K2URS3_LEPSM
MSVYHTHLLDSIALGWFIRELSCVEYGSLNRGNSPYFTCLLLERVKRVKSY